MLCYVNNNTRTVQKTAKNTFVRLGFGD